MGKINSQSLVRSKQQLAKEIAEHKASSRKDAADAAVAKEKEKLSRRRGRAAAATATAATAPAATAPAAAAATSTAAAATSTAAAAAAATAATATATATAATATAAATSEGNTIAKPGGRGRKRQRSPSPEQLPNTENYSKFSNSAWCKVLGITRTGTWDDAKKFNTEMLAEVTCHPNSHTFMKLSRFPQFSNRKEGQYPPPSGLFQQDKILASLISVIGVRLLYVKSVSNECSFQLPLSPMSLVRIPG
jgi:hypothetical protein